MRACQFSCFFVVLGLQGDCFSYPVEVDEKDADIGREMVVGGIILVEEAQVGIFDFGHPVACLEDAFPDVRQWVFIVQCHWFAVGIADPAPVAPKDIDAVGEKVPLPFLEPEKHRRKQEQKQRTDDVENPFRATVGGCGDAAEVGRVEVFRTVGVVASDEYVVMFRHDAEVIDTV